MQDETPGHVLHALEQLELQTGVDADLGHHAGALTESSRDGPGRHVLEQQVGNVRVGHDPAVELLSVLDHPVGPVVGPVVKDEGAQDGGRHRVEDGRLVGVVVVERRTPHADLAGNAVDAEPLYPFAVEQPDGNLHHPFPRDQGWAAHLTRSLRYREVRC